MLEIHISLFTTAYSRGILHSETTSKLSVFCLKRLQYLSPINKNSVGAARSKWDMTRGLE